MAVGTSIKRGYNKDAGYKIPAVVDPNDAICVRVYVPRDTLYIGAFWSAYQYFTSWVAWERDAEHRAKDAATVWKFWYNMAREEYDAEGGVCGVNDIRQKPDYPCIIQKRIGQTWTDVVDLRLCVPKMRFFNGVLQQDITGSGDWVNAAGESDPPYSEQTDGPFIPAWTNPPEGQSGDCLSASNVAKWIMYIVFTFATSFAVGGQLGVVISAVVGYLTSVMTMGVAEGVAALLVAGYAWQATEWQDVADYCVTATSKLMELMFCRFSTDGSITYESYLGLVSDCQAWQATLVGNDAAVRCWSMIIGLLELLGNVGLSRAGNIWGVVSEDCGSIVCGEWEHVWDFETGAQGWELYPSPWNAGVVSGGAWHSEIVQPDTWRKMHYISVEFPAQVSLTSLHHIITVEKGLWVGGESLAWAVRLWLGENQMFGGWEKSYNSMTDATDYDQLITGDAVICDKIEIFASCSRGYEEATGTFDTLSVRVTGTGDNPWG